MKRFLHSIIQLAIIIFLIIAFIAALKYILPGTFSTFVLSFLNDIPFVGDMLTLVDAVIGDVIHGNPLLTADMFIRVLGNNLYETFFVTFWMLTVEEIDRLIAFNKGAKILAMSLGAFFGCFCVGAMSVLHVSVMGKVWCMVITVGVWIGFTIAAGVRHSKGAWGVIGPILFGYLSAGVQAIVAGVMGYWACCIVTYVHLGSAGTLWYFLMLVLIPTILLTVGFVLNYLLFLVTHPKKKGAE